MTRVKKRIYRDCSKRIVGGVCSGLSHYLGLDRVLIRLFFLVCVFVFGFTIPVYIILWVIIPKARTDEEKTEMFGGNYEKVNPVFSELKKYQPKNHKKQAVVVSKVPSPIGTVFIFLLIVLCLLGITTIIGFSFKIPVFLELIREVDISLILRMKKSLLGIMEEDNPLSIYVVSTLGKFVIPFIVGIIFCLKSLGKTNASSKIFNVLGMTWLICLLINHFFS